MLSNKHMSMYLMLLLPTEVQIQTTMKNNYASTGMTKIEKTDSTEFWEGCRAIELLYVLVGVSNGTIPLENWHFDEC